MANVADKVASIRQAVYGKDVRESIASGIEAINTEVENTTGRQNVIDSQEQTRINAENTRIANETARQTKETARVNAETTRATNESTRQTNETARVNAETTRATNESTRQTNETTRVNAENTRETNETARINAENIRTSNESTRQTNETARINAESTRDANETIRQTNETTRVTNENNRQTSFQNMQTTFDSMIHSDPILEITEARGGEVDLGARLDVMTDSITTNTTKIGEVETEVDLNTASIISIEDELHNQNLVTPQLSFGMNSRITNSGKISNPIKFNIQGKTVINLLGSDGNCEDVSKWSYDRCTATLDSTNKVLGTNGFKVTLTATTSTYMYKALPSSLDTTKYYLISAYVKNGNLSGAVRIYKNNSGGGNQILGTLITDASKFSRTGIVVSPADLKNGDGIGIIFNGVSGEYAYTDGIMVNEITAEEYMLGTDVLLSKYPYVDSYTCLKNPYIEVRHDNLVRNGNCEEGIAWWNNTYNILSIVNGKFQLITTAANQLISQKIKVKPNTDYYLNGNTSGNTSIYVNDVSNLINLRVGTGSFNTGSYSEILIGIVNAVVGTGTADSIILVEGTTPPTEYKSQRIERVVVEGDFADGDYVTYDNGEVSGQINWKHKTLYGKDYDWIYHQDYTGYKCIRLNTPITNATYTTKDVVMVKYDGKLLLSTTAPTTGDCLNFQTVFQGIYISDTDTGWTESINPNNDEAKAFMNGWKSVYNDGTRYKAWVNVVDGTGIPTLSAVATNAGTNATVINFTSHPFVVGDVIYLSYIGSPRTITAVTATSVTISVAGSWLVGHTFNKVDDASSALLTYCKNNVAPGYEGYRIHYKLQNPEPITDINTHVYGDIPIIDNGDNYIYIDSGVILEEETNPQLRNNGGTEYDINMVLLPTYPDSRLRNKVETVFDVYKNGIYDFNNWVAMPSSVNGKYYYMNPNNFDISATYTVDYKILATQAPQVGQISCSFTQDIVSTLSSLQESVNSRQTHDSALDTIVDLSEYEEQIIHYIASSWTAIGSTLYLSILVPISPKKVVPTFKISNVKITVGGVSVESDVTSKFVPSAVVWLKNKVRVMYYTTDTTTISNIKTYGANYYFKLIADCKNNV